MRTEKHIIKNRYSTHGIHRNIPVYEMNTVHCSASPMEGYKGTEVTLIDNAAWNEKFSAWALTGATATSNNIVLNNDVTAQGIYETAKNITYGARTSGNKVSGFIGDQVTITGTPAWNEKTSSYSITGATLTGNKFNLTGSNVTAKANFETAKNIQTNGCTVTPTSGFIGTVVTAVPNPAWNEKLSSYNTTGATHTGNNFTITGNSVVISAGFETAKNVTLQTDGGGTINSTKMSGFIGDQATLSNTPDATHVFSGYTITGATLTGNKFNFIGSNVTAKAWFYYVSPTKNARIALRFYDLANSFTSGGKTFYPFFIHQKLVVTGYTGDNIDSLMTTIDAAGALYYAYPLWNNGDTASQVITYTANSINFNKVDNVHLYANTGTTTAGCYEIRGRCNVNNEIIALQQYEWSASQWINHQVNPRNIQDSNNLWIYGRGQGVITDHNVAGSALSAALNNENIPVEVVYWYNSTAMCAPNPVVQHSDIIADITWTE